VIDENFNWTFGKGHLVLNGDFFDRGRQVTECLWLIYSLEEKARKEGGYVHFILGNHEIMNLSGDIRYVKDKYKQNAKKIGFSYPELYNTNTELGRWLRTKNIMEKIGEILFVHAGISKEVNNMPLSISQINEIARVFYDKDSIAIVSNDINLKTIFLSKSSPFWYRLYYQDRDVKIYINGDTVYKASTLQINETLEKFHVTKIVTGHSIVADTISLHFDGKVLNVDTHHSKGKSEALLIEESRYYRIRQEGKIELFFTATNEHLVSVK
jgi:hypothetical protein